MKRWISIALKRVEDSIIELKEKSLFAKNTFSHQVLSTCPVCAFMKDLGYQVSNIERGCPNEYGLYCPALSSCRDYLDIRYSREYVFLRIIKLWNLKRRLKNMK